MYTSHYIWCTYGTWLPPNPRGTWPKFVAAWEETQSSLRRSASVAQDSSAVDPFRIKRELAERARLYPAVRLDTLQMQGIVDGLERFVRSRRIWVWAFAISPGYVQMVATSRQEKPELLSNQLRGEATRRLNELELHPLRGFLETNSQHPMMWSHVKWLSPLNDDETVRQAILYVQALSDRECPSEVACGFVKPFQSLRVCREQAEEYSVTMEINDDFKAIGDSDD